MLFKGDDEISKVVKANCNCGCNAEIQIMKIKDEDAAVPTEYFLSLHNSKWDEEQLGIFSVLGKRLKRAWCALRGKDYTYMEICFDEKELKAFAKLIEDMYKKK